MKREYFVVTLIGILCLVFGFSGNITSTANEQHQIFTLADALQKEEGSIQNWTIYARKSLSQIRNESDWNQLVQKFQEKYQQFEWDYSHNSHQSLLKGHANKDGYTSELRLIATPKNDVLHTYLIYVVTSENWNKKQVSIAIDELTKFWNGEFAEKPQTFSCIEGVFNDTMFGDLQLKTDQILSSLDAKQTEALIENEFVSVSGYSEKLSTEKNQFYNMNVQIGLRKNGLGARTTFVVGTPIITIEY